MGIITRSAPEVVRLVKQSFDQYRAVLKIIWPAVLLFSVAKAIATYVEKWVSWHPASIVAWLSFSLVMVFALGLLLYQTNEVLCQRSRSLKQSIVAAIRCYPYTILATIVIGVIMLVTVLVPLGVFVFFVSGKNAMIIGVAMFLFVMAVILAQVTYFFFVIPLIVIDRYTVYGSFVRSGEFVRSDYKIIIFVYLCFMILFVLTAPFSLHALWLRDHYLTLPFDMLIFSLVLPWLLSLVVLSLKYMQMRIAEYEEDEDDEEDIDDEQKSDEQEDDD